MPKKPIELELLVSLLVAAATSLTCIVKRIHDFNKYGSKVENPVAVKYYVVKPGDVLWKIAEEYCPENIERGDYVEKTVGLNKKNNPTFDRDKIHPGDTIVLPVYNSEVKNKK